MPLIQPASIIDKNLKPYDLIVIGGGAAGFFGAINAAESANKFNILILEKTTKLLSKVKISGGGRCNITHHSFEPTPLSQHYPRGQKELKKLFRVFQAKDTVEWFESRDVKLKTEDDNRMFPESDNSGTIINCFLALAEKHKIKIRTGEGADSISRTDDYFNVVTHSKAEIHAYKVLVAIGGHPRPEAYSILRDLRHKIIPVIPSLFTFNDADKKFTDLMGVAVNDAEVKIAGSSYQRRGPVLITHWGLSGPAVIKLSSWAALYLNGLKYEFMVLVNWAASHNEESMRNLLQSQRSENIKRKIINHPIAAIPQRLWGKIVGLAEIADTKIWGEASNKDINRLLEFIIRCPFQIRGKTTFKEEFVTCGGVDLSEINLETMESKIVPGLYFAGEVLNIDGETGGFNFQSAWTTSFIAAKAITKSLHL